FALLIIYPPSGDGICHLFPNNGDRAVWHLLLNRGYGSAASLAIDRRLRVVQVEQKGRNDDDFAQFFIGSLYGCAAGDLSSAVTGLAQIMEEPTGDRHHAAYLLPQPGTFTYQPLCCCQRPHRDFLRRHLVYTGLLC